MLHRLVGARRVGGRYGRDAFVQRQERIDHDEPVAVVQQALELLARLFREDDHRAVGGSVHQALEQRDLALVLVHRRAEDEAHVLLVERLGGAAHELREIRIVDHRHRGPDQAGPAAGEAARAAIRGVAPLPDDPVHELARLRRHVLAAVDDAGHGRDRHAGQLGDLADRHAAVGALTHALH